MNTVMTKDDVFEAVLEKYASAERIAIGETSFNLEKDYKELSQEIKELRERYYTAEPTFARDIGVPIKYCRNCKHFVWGDSSETFWCCDRQLENKTCKFESLV